MTLRTSVGNLCRLGFRQPFHKAPQGRGERERGKLRGFLGRVAGDAQSAAQLDLDNAPAHRGPAMRSYLETPCLNLRLMNLPGCSPDFNADEAVWGWVREEATGNLCLGSKVLVQQRVGNSLSGPASRSGEVKRRCRTVLQVRAEALLRDSQPASGHTPNAHPALALVYELHPNFPLFPITCFQLYLTIRPTAAVILMVGSITS